MVRIAIGLLRIYRYFLSPLLGPRCRFMPSCSEYAMQALHTHGAVRGGWLSARRLCKCHPWHPGGFDPVPDPTGRPDSQDPASRSVQSAIYRRLGRDSVQ
jgi:putative membrane protein insertion efficiency factor